jgi:hypothetical protein
MILRSSVLHTDVCPLRPLLILSTVILALFTASTASALSLPETAYGHIALTEPVEVVVEEVQTLSNTEAIVRNYFKDTPVLIEIARCESTFRHKLDDGSVLRGRVDQADTGVRQINKRYHLSSATAMDLNLEDIYHNMAYARHLYETQGTQPWSSSAQCWNKNLAANF